jgi:glycosyltransferase involved in cell wall biosynthesis
VTALTVVVPAHDEEALIAGTLRSLRDEPSDRLDLIVVANGCTDHTAEAVAASGLGARLVEIPEASKIRALNAGSRLVETYPVAFVDADVSVAGSDLVALAGELEASGAGVASPRMRVQPSSSWWVRQYYRAWALTDYRSTGHIGSGVYMLSEAGRRRFGDFPDVIADDLFVQQLFAPDERCTPENLEFSVAAPGSLAALVRRNTRIAAGNLQIARVFPEFAAPGSSAGARSLLRRVRSRPSVWIGFGVYAVVYSLTRSRAHRMLARRHPVAWNRDETTRRSSA